MSDLVVGLGEIGDPILTLLKQRGFQANGWDLTNRRKLRKKYDFVHICFPYSKKFLINCEKWAEYGPLIVHSTVVPGTCKLLNCVYSPVRGVHARMLSDLEHYTKYYSGPINPKIEERFRKTRNVQDSTELETTKIIVDTTYYGWLIAFRKYVDSKYKVDWSYAEEINEALGNRPIMYNDNKPIGGHCVVQNLDLIDDELFREVIK